MVETYGTEELTGECIAQHASDHAMTGSPLADYTIDNRDGTSGLAGIIGAIVTVIVAGTVFWLIARSKPSVGD